MELRKILSGTAAFTMAFSFFSGIQVSAGETVTLDQKIINQIYDRNSDGVISITDVILLKEKIISAAEQIS